MAEPYQMADHSGVMDFGQGMSGYHGLLWLVLTLTIALLGFALYLSWRQERGEVHADAGRAPNDPQCGRHETIHQE